MPISQNIIDEVNKLKISEKERNLMIDILEFEDAGNYHYSDKYDGLIKDYISDAEEGDDNE